MASVIVTIAGTLFIFFAGGAVFGYVVGKGYL